MARIKITRKAIREQMIPQSFSEKMACPQCFAYGSERKPQPPHHSNDSHYDGRWALVQRQVTQRTRAQHAKTCPNFGKYWVEACEGSECIPGHTDVVQEACSYCHGEGFVMCEVSFALAPAEQLEMVS